MPRSRKDNETGTTCNRCSYEWARGYVSKRLKLPPDHWKVKVLTNAFRQHHWLTFPSSKALGGHMEEQFGPKAKDTGFIGSQCGWWSTMHELYGNEAAEDGGRLSVADAWLGETRVRQLGLKEHKAGVVMVSAREEPKIQEAQDAIF